MALIFLCAGLSVGFVIGNSRTPFPETPPADPTANWETYISPLAYGKNFLFSFKYPNSIREGGYGSIPGPFTEKYTSLGGLSDPTALKEGTDTSFDGFAIYGVVNQAGSIEKYVDNEIVAMSKSELASNKNLIKNPIPLNGIQSYSVDFSPTLKYYYLSSPDGKAVIIISRVYANQSFLTIFNQIISTFKFLDQSNAEGKFCGGITANLPENQCPGGFYCKLDGNYPDAGGVCIPTNSFTCPPGEWVNCMPGPNAGERIECTSEYLNWAAANCPNFKGAAL